MEAAFGLESEYEVDVFEREDREIRSISRDADFDADVVKSLGDLWPAGISTTAFSRTFTNTGLALWARPAVEYNVFPYAISDEKELPFTYRIGPEYRDYREETISGKNRLQFRNFLYVRLVEGLNLRFQFGVEFIQDQLHLPRGDVPLEEVLLRRQDLTTDYELDLSIGLSDTFGSIYNNVVNTRL